MQGGSLGTEIARRLIQALPVLFLAVLLFVNYGRHKRQTTKVLLKFARYSEQHGTPYLPGPTGADPHQETPWGFTHGCNVVSDGFACHWDCRYVTFAAEASHNRT